MKIQEAIEKRYSVRQYDEVSISQEHMRILLEALQLAPSANNSQNWKFIFVSDADLKKRLVAGCFNQRFVAECAYFIAGVADPGLKWHMVDITIAMTNFTLQATELGYGTCWIGAFDEDVVKLVIGVPMHMKVVICMTFGKPKGQSFFKSRKSIEEFVYLNQYGKVWKIPQDKE